MIVSRREAIRLVGLGVAGLTAACRRASEALQPRPTSLDALPAERQATLAAAMDRVMPGAAAAGALTYLGRALEERPFKGMLREFDTLALLMGRVARQRFQRPYAECAPDEQDQVLAELRDGKHSGKSFDSAGAVKRLAVFTLEGFFGDPKYGGNQGEVGWRLIGWQRCHFAPKHLTDVVHGVVDATTLGR